MGGGGGRCRYDLSAAHWLRRHVGPSATPLALARHHLGPLGVLAWAGCADDAQLVELAGETRIVVRVGVSRASRDRAVLGCVARWHLGPHASTSCVSSLAAALASPRVRAARRARSKVAA